MLQLLSLRFYAFLEHYLRLETMSVADFEEPCDGTDWWRLGHSGELSGPT